MKNLVPLTHRTLPWQGRCASVCGAKATAMSKPNFPQRQSVASWSLDYQDEMPPGPGGSA